MNNNEETTFSSFSDGKQPKEIISFEESVSLNKQLQYPLFQFCKQKVSLQQLALLKDSTFLTSIDLTENGIKGKLATVLLTFENLTNLTSLKLDRNEISFKREKRGSAEGAATTTSSSSTSSSTLLPLTELSAEDSQAKKMMQNMTRLKSLFLKNNSIKDWPFLLEGSTTLEELDLSFNELSHFITWRLYQQPSAQLHQMMSVTSTINSSSSKSKSGKKSPTRGFGNKLKSIFGFGSSCEQVDTDSIPMRQPSLPVVLAPLCIPSLKSLNLTCNQLQSFPESIWNDFRNIEMLDISHNHVATIPRQIDNMKSLNHLIVRKCGLSEFPSELFALDKLQFLDFGENNVATSSNALESTTKSSSSPVQRTQRTSAPSTPQTPPSGSASFKAEFPSPSQYLPFDIRSINSLTHLDVSKCNFVDISSCFTLPKVKTIIANENKLYYLVNRMYLQEVSKGEEFDISLESLVELQLSKNFIKSLDTSQGDFKNLKSLTTLKVDSNKLEDISDEFCKSCPQLENLALNHNSLKYLPASFSLLMKKLVNINISYNKLQKLPSDLFKEAPNLVRFEAHHNCISGKIQLDSNLKSLQTLLLSSNQITEISEELFSITSLQTIDVQDNRIQAFDLDQLKALPNLALFNIGYNEIATTCKASLSDLVAALPKLSFFSIEQNSQDFSIVTEEEISKIQKIRPALRFLSGFEIPDLVEQGMFIGSARSLSNVKFMQGSLKITHILNVAKDVPPKFQGDFKHKHLKITEHRTTKLKDYYAEAFEFINDANRSGGAVLVHCLAGVSRSASIIIAFLMQRDKISYEEATSKVKQVRSIILPNEYFRKQLAQYSEELNFY